MANFWLCANLCLAALMGEKIQSFPGTIVLMEQVVDWWLGTCGQQDFWTWKHLGKYSGKF